MNGAAEYLPKPIYSEEAKLYCADGKVEVEVEYGSDGKLRSARAISGDELLLESSLNAARKARFKRFGHGRKVILTGKLVYNFSHLSKCINAGVVNKKAISLPKPVLGNIPHPSHLQISSDTIIDAHIVVDEAGKVISARVLTGHPLVRTEFERSALGAKFPPIFINPGPVKAKAVLRYFLKPNGEISF